MLALTISRTREGVFSATSSSTPRGSIAWCRACSSSAAIEASEAPLTFVDLRALCQRAIERSQTPDGALVLSYESKVHLVRARESDLETALLNLLDNALRFSPPGVPVELAARGERGARFVELSVTDRGPGVPPEHLPRLFERFFTTDAERDGTGLSLAIVRSVVRAHGGSVNVESPAAGGARFVMRLPPNLERASDARSV